jgi:hypothetical protein
VPVGFVNSVVEDFQGILNPWPAPLGPQASGGQKERIERARERFTSDFSVPLVAEDSEDLPLLSLPTESLHK